MGTFYRILTYIFAIILPPIAVLMVRGLSADVLINIALTILGWIPGKYSTHVRLTQMTCTLCSPGVIHAFYIIAKYQTRTTSTVIVDGGGTEARRGFDAL